MGLDSPSSPLQDRRGRGGDLGVLLPVLKVLGSLWAAPHLQRHMWEP